MRKQRLAAQLKSFQRDVTDAIETRVLTGSFHGIGDGNDDRRDEELKLGPDESPMQLETQSIEVDDGAWRVVGRSMRRQVARQSVDDYVQRHVHRTILALVKDSRGILIFVAVIVTTQMTTTHFGRCRRFIMRAQFESIKIANLLVLSKIVFL